MGSLTPDETLLGLLASRARHGYELLDCFSDPGQLGEVWKLSTSQVYAVLKRLASQGLTEVYDVPVPDAPMRKEYRITEQGLARLEAWLDEPAPSSSIHRVRVEFLSRLYIARLLNLPTTTIVECQKAVCRHRRDELAARLEQTEPGVGRLTLELNIAQLGVILQWLDRCEIVPRFTGER